MNFLCLVANFYISLYPVGGPYLDAEAFFQGYLAAPFIVFLYVGWKIYSWFKFPAHRPLYVKIKDIDIYSGMREGQALMISGEGVTEQQRHQSIAEIQDENKKKGIGGWAKAAVRSVF
jgi:yeast amino acid transporter